MLYIYVCIDEFALPINGQQAEYFHQKCQIIVEHDLMRRSELQTFSH